MKLCYVDPDSRVMFFTETPIEKVWGDDWNDAPWEHNAGDPYEEFGPFKRLIIDADLDMPGNESMNSRYSVEQINMGIVPWLVAPSWFHRHMEFRAGAEYDDVVKKCKERRSQALQPIRCWAVGARGDSALGEVTGLLPWRLNIGVGGFQLRCEPAQQF